MAECVWTNEQKIALKDKLDEIEGKIDALIAKDHVQEKCKSCNGTGKRTGYDGSTPPAPYEYECEICNGTGKLLFGRLESE